jgi:hypothetical protein
MGYISFAPSTHTASHPRRPNLRAASGTKQQKPMLFKYKSELDESVKKVFTREFLRPQVHSREHYIARRNPTYLDVAIFNFSVWQKDLD